MTATPKLSSFLFSKSFIYIVFFQHLWWHYHRRWQCVIRVQLLRVVASRTRCVKTTDVPPHVPTYWYHTLTITCLHFCRLVKSRMDSSLIKRGNPFDFTIFSTLNCIRKKKRQWFLVFLSYLFNVLDTGCVGIHSTQNIDSPDNIWHQNQNWSILFSKRVVHEERCHTGGLVHWLVWPLDNILTRYTIQNGSNKQSKRTWVIGCWSRRPLTHFDVKL